MDEVGANPARIIPAWRRFLDEHAVEGRPVRGIGEPIWAGRSPDELVECQRHESLLNLAFADAPAFRLLCPYDIDRPRRRRDRRGACAATRTSSRTASGAPAPAIRGLSAIAAPFAEPLPAPPASVRSSPSTASRSGPCAGSWRRARPTPASTPRGRATSSSPSTRWRRTASATAAAPGRCGSGSGTRWLVCEIEDGGRIEDPLAGREEPTPDQQDGRGLWIANQVCDLVQVRTFATHTVVRLHMRRAPEPGPTGRVPVRSRDSRVTRLPARRARRDVSGWVRRG